MISASELARMVNGRGIRVKKIKGGIIAHNDNAAIFVSISKGNAKCAVVVDGVSLDRLATFVLNEVSKLGSNRLLAEMIFHYMSIEPYEFLKL